MIIVRLCFSVIQLYMFFSNILHILCDLNFNNTTNCIIHIDLSH